MNPKFLTFIVFCLISYTVLSQTAPDTVILKNGKKILGTVQKILPSSKVVNINVLKLGSRQYKRSDIKRIGYCKKEFFNPDVEVFLRSKTVVVGKTIEKNNNNYIILLTERSGIRTIQDVEIDSIRDIVKPDGFEKNLLLKNGTQITGYLLDYSIENKIRFVSNSGNLKYYNVVEIEKIEENSPHSNMHEFLFFTAHDTIQGEIINNNDTLMRVMNPKYGYFTIHKKDLILMKYPSENVDQKNETHDAPPKNTLKGHLMKAPVEAIRFGCYAIKECVGLFGMNAGIIAGAVSNDIYSYGLIQFGYDATWFKYGKYSSRFDFRVGLATDFERYNTSLNICPLLVGYNLTPELGFLLGPDVDLRFYENGTNTRVGLTIGSEYIFCKKYIVGLRTSLNERLFIGISAKYVLSENWIKKIGLKYRR